MIGLFIIAILAQGVPLQPGQPAPRAGVLITKAMGERMKQTHRDALACKVMREVDAGQCRISLAFEAEQRELDAADHAAALVRLAKAPAPPRPPLHERPAFVWPVAMVLGGLAGWWVAHER